MMVSYYAIRDSFQIIESVQLSVFSLFFNEMYQSTKLQIWDLHLSLELDLAANERAAAQQTNLFLRTKRIKFILGIKYN